MDDMDEGPSSGAVDPETSYYEGPGGDSDDEEGEFAPPSPATRRTATGGRRGSVQGDMGR